MDQNRCGAEFLRSPLASKPGFALQAEAFFTIKARGYLTAVAIAVENDHTIAFLGNSMGEILKVSVTDLMAVKKISFNPDTPESGSETWREYEIEGVRLCKI